MDIRFYIDPATGEPHVLGHQVSLEEVGEALAARSEDRPGDDGSRVAIGQTQGGRFLRVIYVPDWDVGSIFVVTAYELTGRALWAFRRRKRRRR